jgi:tRNA pseudouridine38-40 synthase
MHNYKLIIQYDGTEYAGWQIQKNAVSVQQKITDAIAIILKEKVTLTGSGRTDTGVHALGQAANFKTEQSVDLYKFKYQLNSILSNDISIIDLAEEQEKFNARFDAKKRSYLYFISKRKTPFLQKYSFRYNGVLDIEKLNLLSRVILGEHDFTSFARKKTETINKVCNIYNIHWKDTRDMIVFYIEADRFLHGMVRTIVGTLIDALSVSNGEEYLLKIIEKRNRECAGEAVPGCGLFLYKVKY